ncbi:MAG: serine/threonine protein kinase [Gemmatimonadetes bacterium]|nr:serine/threonine protein kinase [Gemmatimonadota bacterium]
MKDILGDLRTALADRYAVEDVLGAGGMATVYLAEDLRHHRQVAVKVLDPDLAAAVGEERFLREVEVTATLRHPHILPLLDSGEADGFLYYVMPFVEGPSLRERITRERQIPVDEAVRIAREVADALAHAHAHDVVHRDVKPENILLESGHAVVADFGIARAAAVAGGDRLTRTGMMVGTPAYASPEQMAGDHEVDGRSDIHGLGCVLYEMLIGEPPYSGATLPVILARKTAGLRTSVRELRPAVPQVLEQTITRALAVLPADRQQSAEELERELSGVLESGLLRSTTAAPAARAPARRVPGWALVMAGVLAVATSVLWWKIGRSGASRDPLANRVVVLPYENVTGDASLDPVGRMVADWITEGLAQTPGVLVVPTSTVLEAMTMVDGERNGSGTAEVARLAHAGVAVTGSYYRRGDDLEFHSEVADVTSGTRLAAVQPIRGPVSDFQAAVDSVRMQVMGALATRLSELTAWEIPPTVQPPTYDAFLEYSRGLESWAKGDYASAADALMHAYALDTTYVRSLMLAMSAASNAGDAGRVASIRAMLQSRREGLSPYDRYRFDWSEARRRGDRNAALAAAREGARLVPYGTAHSALLLSLIDLNRPREALANAEEIASNNPMALRWYALPEVRAELLHALGEHERELAVVREAYDHISADRRFLMESEGRALAALGRESELAGIVDEIAATPPGLGIDPGEVLLTIAGEARAHGLPGTRDRALEQALAWWGEQPNAYRKSERGRALEGRLLCLAERWDEASEVFRALPGDSTHVDVLGYRGVIAAHLGDPAAARSWADVLAGLGPERGRAALWRARIAASMGERDEAVDLLRRAFAQGAAFGLWVHVDPDLEPLRGYPPYEEIVRPKG